VSLFLQIGIFLTVFSQVTVNISANYDDVKQRNTIIYELEKVATLLGLFFLGLVIVGGPWLKHFFQFGEVWPFIILGAGVVLSVPFTLRNAFLRGRQQFGAAAASNLVVAGGKLLLSLGLVLAGLGTSGAIGGVAAAQLIALWYINPRARRAGLTPPHQQHWRKLPDVRTLLPELKYAGLVLISSLLVMLQFSIDIIVVKHYFDARTAGLYAGVAAVARIIFFVNGSISQVLMSSVRLHQPAAKNRQLLLRSQLLLAGISLPVLAVLGLFPKFAISLLMGHGYTTYAALLPLLAFTIFVITNIHLLVSYNMALRRYEVAVVAAMGAAITYGLLLSHHHSLQAVVSNLFYGSVAMLALFVPLSAIRARKQESI